MYKLYLQEREGETVASWKESIKPPRPMTYDLISSILNLSDSIVLTKPYIQFLFAVSINTFTMLPYSNLFLDEKATFLLYIFKTTTSYDL